MARVRKTAGQRASAQGQSGQQGEGNSPGQNGNPSSQNGQANANANAGARGGNSPARREFAELWHAMGNARTMERTIEARVPSILVTTPWNRRRSIHNRQGSLKKSSICE